MVKGYGANIDSPWVISYNSYSTSIDPTIVSVTIFEMLTCNIDDLELRQFKVIHGQSLVVQIDSAGAFSYSASIDPIVVSVTIFEIFDIKAIFPLDASLKVS